MGSSARLEAWAACVCAAVAPGCGGKSTNKPEPVSLCAATAPSHPESYAAGTRLKPMVYDAGCGAEQHSGYWFDSELDEECAFMLTEDGVERCVPRWFGASFYADADCTWPVAGHVDCGTPLPRFAVDEVGDPASCSDGRHLVYRVGEPIAEDAPVFYGDAGACPSSARIAGVTFYALEHVPPETFVAARGRSLRERTSLLAAEVLEAEDGSWRITGFFDPARGSKCEGSDSWEPRGRCIPPHTAPSTPPDRFSDPECTIGVAQGYLCQEPPHVWFENAGYSGPACEMRNFYDLYEIGGPAETTYLGTPGDCSLGPAVPPDSAGLSRGAPIDPEALPAVHLLDLGSGRVQARFWAAEGVPFYPIGFIEAETGIECYLRPFVDGVTRCVPSSWPLGSYRERSDCSGVVAGVRGCAPEPPGLLTVPDKVACSSLITGAFSAIPHDGAIYKSEGEECTSVPRTTFGTEGQIFRAGIALAPAERFGEVKLAVRD